jgi:hypothetical protein
MTVQDQKVKKHESEKKYKEMNIQMNKLVNIVDSLKSEKKLLIQTVRMMNKETKSILFFF